MRDARLPERVTRPLQQFAAVREPDHVVALLRRRPRAVGAHLGLAGTRGGLEDDGLVGTEGGAYRRHPLLLEVPEVRHAPASPAGGRCLLQYHVPRYRFARATSPAASAFRASRMDTPQPNEAGAPHASQ